MYKPFFLLFLLLSGMLVFGQDFEGEVVYTITYKSKLPNLTDEQLTALVGNKQEYFIKEGKYKSIMNGQAIAMQLFDDSTNRIYNKVQKSDTLYWFSASVNDDEILGYEIKKDEATILGKKCDALHLKTKAGTSTYYYSKLYLIDGRRFKKHNYGNWGFYTSASGAVPLKIVIDNKQFVMESTAVEIKVLELSKEFFEINTSIPIKQSGQ